MSNIETIVGLQAKSFESMKNMLGLTNAFTSSANGTSKIQGTQWRRTIWSGERGNYIGSATAEKGASLSGLAYLITGNGIDFKELGLTQQAVEIGQTVQIAALLQKLELRLRVSVIEATKKFKAKGFSEGTSITGGGNPAAGINEYFGGNAKLESDCLGAGIIVLEKGVLDIIGNNLFNRLETAYEGFVSQEVKKVSREDSVESMLLGDMAHFPNYDDYLEYAENPAAWRGENVIKVEESPFWGYIGEPQYTVKSKEEWEAMLRDEFNKLEKFKATGAPPRQGRIPGIAGKIKIDFVDVAAIAMQTFDLRRKGFR